MATDKRPARKPAVKKPATTPAPTAAAPLPTLHDDHRRALVEGRHPRPHDALGPHAVDGGWVVRVVRPPR